MLWTDYVAAGLPATGVKNFILRRFDNEVAKKRLLESTCLLKKTTMVPKVIVAT
jgi:hypothetical protein